MSAKAVATFELSSAAVGTLRCAACASRACESISSVPGVSHIVCDPTGSAVRVEYDPGRVSEADLLAEVERFGATIGEAVRHSAWRVSGLD